MTLGVFSIIGLVRESVKDLFTSSQAIEATFSEPGTAG